MKNSQPHRILWVDFAKVIGIWLVILGHMGFPSHTETGSSSFMTKFIFAFHIPLFFFLSGYLEKNKKTLKETVINGVKTLIIPYIILYGLFYVYWFFIVFLRHPELYANEPILSTLGKPIIGLLLGLGSDSPYSVMLNVPLWFLVALFFVKIIHQIIIKISKCNNIYIYIYIISVGIIIVITFLLKQVEINMLLLLKKYIAISMNTLRVPFSIDCALLVFPFFALGNIIREKGLIKPLKNDKKSLFVNVFIIIISYLILFFAVTSNGKVDINNFMYGKNIFLFYGLGITGIISIICLSLLYKYELKIITIISNGTIIILAFHNLINSYIYKITEILAWETNFIAATIIISIVNIVLTIVPIIIVQRYFPVILGRKK